jgi:hypothetical protein
MRIIISTCAGLLALCAISVEAAPLAPAKAGPTPSIELAAHECGYGQRRTQWQDHWGHWHWGRCVPKTWGSLSRHQFSQ